VVHRDVGDRRADSAMPRGSFSSFLSGAGGVSSIDHWWCRGCGAMELWHAGKKRKKKENNYKELKMIWGKIFPAFTLFFEDVFRLFDWC